MVRLTAGLVLVTLVSGVAFGQAAEPTPTFTVADVHTSPHTAGGWKRSLTFTQKRPSATLLIATLMTSADAGAHTLSHWTGSLLMSCG